MLCVWSVKGKDNKELRSLETGSLRSSFEPLVTSSKPSVDYLQSLSLECMVKHFSFSLSYCPLASPNPVTKESLEVKHVP